MPLLYGAIGDAFGRTFEFNTQQFIEENNDGLSYKHREGEEQTGIGTYTDDTQMSIAIAEQILSDLPGTQVRFAAHFVTAYKRDPRGGYSKRIKNALESTKENLPFEFILKANQAGMSSNGSVMRAVPLGLLPDPKEIMYRSIVQTSTSHGHIDAVNAATAVSLAAHYFYYLLHIKIYRVFNNDLAVVDFLDWMSKQLGDSTFDDIYYAYDLYDKERLECDAKTTASLSIKLALYGTSASQILKDAIQIGGDTDSSASIALGLYSLRSDAVMDLPDALYNNLENGKYGRDYLVQLDKKLFEKFPRGKNIEKIEDLIS